MPAPLFFNLVVYYFVTASFVMVPPTRVVWSSIMTDCTEWDVSPIWGFELLWPLLALFPPSILDVLINAPLLGF